MFHCLAGNIKYELFCLQYPMADVTGFSELEIVNSFNSKSKTDFY